MYLIYSNGHSATRWISKNLTIDNYSKCYHSYDLLDLNPNIKNTIDYHNHLKILETKSNLITGSIHLPFNLNPGEFDKLDSMNVSQFCLLRNPVYKINSMMQFYLEKFLTYGFFSKKNVNKSNFNNLKISVEELFLLCNDQVNLNFQKYNFSKNKYYTKYIYETLKLRLKKIFFNYEIIDKNILSKENINFISLVLINLFLYALSSCLRFDQGSKMFADEKIILYEKITLDKKNFLYYAGEIDKNLNLDFLNSSNFDSKVGANFKKQHGSKFWPNSFYSIFVEKIEKKKLGNYYSKIGYKF